jgi:hypothetical protein
MNQLTMHHLLLVGAAAIPLLVDPPMQEFVDWLRNKSGVTKPGCPRVPPWVTGIFERYLAFIVVAFNVENAGTILLAWMAAKLAANWQRQVMIEGSELYNRTMVTYTMIALIAGTLSLLLGALGGLIARCAYRSLV